MTFKKYFLKTAAAVSAAAVLFQAGIQTADLNVFADDYSIMYDEYLSYRRIDEDNDGEYAHPRPGGSCRNAPSYIRKAFRQRVQSLLSLQTEIYVRWI